MFRSISALFSVISGFVSESKFKIGVGDIFRFAKALLNSAASMGLPIDLTTFGASTSTELFFNSEFVEAKLETSLGVLEDPELSRPAKETLF